MVVKYEIQKPSTCRTTLFLCKFWVDHVSHFSPCVINISRKNHWCGLKKCSALIGWFAWCGSKMAAFVAFDEKRAIKAKFVSQSRPASCSTFRNNCLQPTTNNFVTRQIYHARWKTRDIDLKLATKQCFATGGEFLFLVFCRIYTCAKQ